MMKVMDFHAEHNSTGEVLFEELPVDDLGDGYFRLTASPGMVLDLAKGDVIKVLDDGRFEHLERGGNLSLQLFYSPEMKYAVDDFSNTVKEQLGGTLDGWTEDMAVYSVHVTTGFSLIEKIFNLFTSQNPGAEWYYGNVYDPNDGITPLNWWVNMLSPYIGTALTSPAPFTALKDQAFLS